MENTISSFNGDFTLNVLIIEKDSGLGRYIDLYTHIGFSIEIEVMTYVSPGTGEDLLCLYDFWSNLSLPFKIFVLTQTLSDHYATASVFMIRMKTKTKKIRFRNSVKGKISDEVCQFAHPSREVNVYPAYLTHFL